jgi:ATP/maltotriose-dependent transcriptional regulator MalT
MSEDRRTTSANSKKLLNTKLMPPRQHTTVIPRKKLLEQLDAGLTKKLTLVVAPTGFGKTTLVGMWIANRKFLSAWVTLDENDNDPARFWTYIITSLRAVVPSIGKAALSALMAPQPPSYESLLTPLINELTRLKDDFVLVLEDYHAINSGEINRGVSFLIQHLPGALHLVLISRSQPDLPLAILRARDELLEINAAGLRFNQRETEEFLHQSLRADLPAAAITKLLEQTEGWVAGLRLVTLSLQNKGSQDFERLIESFSGSDHYVADYLIEEVFKSQPESRQKFLLKTCFLRRLTGSLCDAVTGAEDGEAVLEGLDRENMFLVQLQHGGDRVWYRFSPLFAESLQYLARQMLDESGLKEIFERASAWYELHGLQDEAIESALSAKSFDHAMRLIQRYIEIHDVSEMTTLGRWLEQIPTHEIFLHPAICFIYAQIILYSSPERFSPALAVRIEPYLQAAETALKSAEDWQRLGELLSLRGIITWWHGDFPKAVEYAHQSLDLLPENDVLWRGNSLLILSQEALDTGHLLEAQDAILEVRAEMGAAQNIHGVLAAIQVASEVAYWQGELDQALELNQQILDKAIGGDEMLDDQGFASLGLSQVAYEKNDLGGASHFAAQALALAERRGNELLQVETSIRLAYIHAAKNEFAQADALLTYLTGNIRNPLLLPSIQETQARLSILSEEGLFPAGWLNKISIGRPDVFSLQREREVFTAVRLQIAQGKAKEVLQSIQGRAAEAAAQGRVRSQVEATCLEALALHANEDIEGATRLLSEALIIGRAKGFRRLILDEGPRMVALLQAGTPLLPERGAALYAATLLHSVTPLETRDQAGSALIAPLSRQEVRVLRLLAAGLSNADIARELIVSTNTVKTHVKSIYRKLSINSRDEARQVGRDLNLL